MTNYIEPAGNLYSAPYRYSQFQGGAMNKPRVVVCAANRFTIPGKFPIVVCGARHFDRVMHMVIRELPFLPENANEEQGFIDQFGVFMTREEAFDVATSAGQIKYRCGGDEGRLFSENLY